MPLIIDLDKSIWERRRVFKTGGCYVVSIPYKTLKAAGKEIGDSVIVVLENE